MPIFVNILALGASALFLLIPILNRNVFHTVNIDEIMVQGYEGLSKVQSLQKDGQFEQSRTEAEYLVHQFKQDSTRFLAGDVYDWSAFLDFAHSGDSIPVSLMRREFNRDLLDSLEACSTKTDLTRRVKLAACDAINGMAGRSGMYARHEEAFPIGENEELQARLDSLVQGGVVFDSDTGMIVKEDLSPTESLLLRRFHMRLLETTAFSSFLKKDPKRGGDWASEYTVQTAIYLIGASYATQFDVDKSRRILDSLIEMYPRTIYSEQIFLQNGQTLLGEGKRLQIEGKKSVAGDRFKQAVEYLKKIEKNREIAKEFPKYKLVDLEPDTYVNIDEASRAKKKIKGKTTIYTQEEAKRDLSGENADDAGGYVLEDAVKLIGECYIEMGETDSARMQFGLLLDFFPESENLDDAQKLIADSYVKEGELILAATDSSDTEARRKANDLFARAVAAYQKFINVFPQSDLVSDAFIAMGDAYYRMQAPTKAEDAFKAALARAKDTEGQAAIQLQIGDYYYERKRYDEAVESYQIILNNFSSTQVAPKAQYLLGECFYATSDTARAIEAYQVIVDHYKRSNFFGGSAFKIGMYHFNKEDYKTALESFSLGYSYEPDGPVAAKTKYRMGLVWRRIADDTEEAKEKEANLKNAIRHLQEVAEKWAGSNDADMANYQIVECYVELDNEKAAREASRNIQRRDMVVKTLKLLDVGGESCEGEVKYWNDQLAAAVEDEERATILYEKGNSLSRCEDFEEALKTFRKSFALSTDRQKLVNARVGMSRVLGGMGRHEEARDTLEALVNSEDVGPELRQHLRIQLYDAYLKNGEKEKAREGFEKFVAEYPDHRMSPYAIYRVGNMLAEDEKPGAAIEQFKTITTSARYAESDMYDKAVLGIGTQTMALGKHQEAVEYLQAFLSENDSASVASHIYLKIAEAYSNELNKKQQALEIFSRIIENYPEDAVFSYAAYRYGILLREMGKSDDAIAAFQKIEKDDKAIYRAGQAEIGKLLAKTDPEAAVENYKRIVEESETAKDSLIAMMGIGDVYTAIKKWDEAAETFKGAYEFYEEDGTDTTLLAGAIVKWVDALINSKKYNQAIEVAQIMQTRFPRNQYTINTMYYEATALFSLKRYGPARKKFDEIIERDESPQLSEIAQYQKADARYFAASGIEDEDARNSGLKAAAREYAAYLEKYPDGNYAPRATYMQANAYWTVQDFETARVKFQQVVSKYPDFDEICNAKNLLAFSLNKLDKWQQAVKIYNEVRRGSSCDGKTKKFADEQAELIIGQH